MHADIARQSLLTAFTTLTAVAVAALYFGPESGAAAQPVIPSPLGDPIAAFQSAHPAWSRLLALLCILFSGLSLGRLSVRYNLYGINCYLAIPLFGMAACGIVCGPDYLVQYLSGLLLTFVIKHFCLAYRNGYGFNAVFRASIYLGILPLVCPAALPLSLLLPLAVFLFRRTLREVAVALFGVLLPAFCISYIAWARGEAMGAPIFDLVTAFYARIGVPEWLTPGSGTIAPLLTGGLVTLLTATAMTIQLQNMYAVNRKARRILLFCGLAFLLSLTTLFLPTARAATASFAAVPAALLLPVFFVRARRSLALAVYLVLLLSACTSILLG